MLYCVIMAGGSGTRFWPESRTSRPKQLLPLVGQQTMLRETFERLTGLVPPERILAATSRDLAPAVAAELPELPADSILAEPYKRNTAPCIGLAALELLRRDPDAVMAVLPADHVISPADGFRRAVALAASLVAQAPQYLITFGIRPSYPAEIFGYIERGPQANQLFPQGAGESAAALPAGEKPPLVYGEKLPLVYKVVKFREKPTADAARQFLAAGNYYWNSGIFMWKASTILELLRRHQPDLYSHLERIGHAAGKPRYMEVLEREFAAMEAISIDYAVMEHATDVLVIEAPFDWDDVGSWQAMARLRGADASGNTVVGRHLGIDTLGTIVRTSEDHLVVTIGLRDCVVVHTPDATLVADKHQEESVRKVVQMLQQRGWTQYL